MIAPRFTFVEFVITAALVAVVVASALLAVIVPGYAVAVFWPPVAWLLSVGGHLVDLVGTLVSAVTS